jgi:hypothetical protein
MHSKQVQRITGWIEPGKNHAFLVRDLRAGDHLTISMRATSGNLDPAVGVMDTARPIAEVEADY